MRTKLELCAMRFALPLPAAENNYIICAWLSQRATGAVESQAHLKVMLICSTGQSPPFSNGSAANHERDQRRTAGDTKVTSSHFNLPVIFLFLIFCARSDIDTTSDRGSAPEGKLLAVWFEESTVIELLRVKLRRKAADSIGAMPSLSPWTPTPSFEHQEINNRMRSCLHLMRSIKLRIWGAVSDRRGSSSVPFCGRKV